MGGFTDVGLHTGGKARSTAWPLLRATIHFFMSGIVFSDKIIDCFFCELEYAWACEWIHSDSAKDYSLEYVDTGVQMLQTAIDSACLLVSVSEYVAWDVVKFRERCKHAHVELQQNINSLWALQMRRYLLKPDPSNDVGDVVFDIKVPKPCFEDRCSFDNLLNTTIGNIGQYPILLTDAPLSEASTWLKSLKDRARTSNQTQEILCLIVNTIEQYVFHKKYLLDEVAQLKTFFSSKDSFSCLESLLIEYGQVVDDFYETMTMSHRLRVNIRSNRIVAMWLSYCLMFAEARERYPLLKEYGVPMHLEDLRHIVLSDYEAIETAKKVALYCQSSCENHHPIFSLGDQKPTFDFAYSFAEQSDRINTVLNNEIAASNRKVSEHWDLITTKQNRLQSLQDKLSNEEQKLRSLEFELKGIAKYEEWKCGFRMEWTNKNSEVCTCKRLIHDLEREIRNEESPPSYVKQALPKDKRKSLQILFFICMPKDLEILSVMGFSSQKLMIQEAFLQNLLRRANVEPYFTSNSYSQLQPQNRINLTTNGQIPKSFGPSRTSHFTTNSDGVWYPDEWNLCMIWTEGVNPFTSSSTTDQAKSDFFTESLTENFNMQWAMKQPGEGVDKTRGNKPESSLTEKPIYFNKIQYLSITSLRAYPHMQLRKLLVALREREIPLSNITTQVMIKQALYHIGPVGDEGVLTWKSDFVNIADEMYNTIEQLSAEVLEKPRERKSIVILAELIGYFSGLDKKFCMLSRNIASTMMKLCEGLDKRVDSCDVENSAIPELRRLQCLHYSYGIIALGSSCAGDYGLMIQLLALLNSRAFFEDDKSSANAELRKAYGSVRHYETAIDSACLLVSVSEYVAWDVVKFRERCKHAHVELQQNINSLWALQMRRYLLKPDPSNDVGDVVFDIKVPKPCFEDRCSFDNLLNTTIGNIGQYPILLTDAPLSEASTWLKSLKDRARTSNQTQEILCLIVNTIEQYVFHKKYLLDEVAQLKTFFSSKDSFSCLESLLIEYGQVVDDFYETMTMSHRLRVNIRSNRIVAMWLSYCLMFAEARERYPLLKEYGVPMHLEDLRHIVLSDYEAIETAKKVALYCQSSCENHHPIFSLGDQKPTFDFAYSFAEQSDRINTVLNNEIAASNRKVSEHWDLITTKQNRLQSLQDKLSNEEQKLRSLEFELKGIAKYEEWKCGFRMEWTNKNSEVCTCKRLIHDLEREIRNEESPPSYVKQALPKDKRKSLQILFFICMPKDLEILSVMGFSSQKLMIQEAFLQNLLRRANVEPYFTSNSYSQLQPQNRINLTTNGQIPKSFGPSRTSHFTTNSDGVWYPDEWNLCMIWTEGVNPFTSSSTTDQAKSDFFTESLTENFNMQWAMKQPGEGVDKTRGNKPESSLTEKPIYFNKIQYLSITSLRAYPHMQLRKLLVALREREIPLSNITTQVMIKQALYHIGPVGDEGVLTWKSDFVNIADEMYNTIEQLSAEVLEKPRERKSIVILAELIGYFSGLDKKFCMLSRNIASTMMKLCEGLDKRVDSCDVENSAIPELRRLQCLHYSYGIIALGSSCAGDYGLMIQLLALLNSRAFFEDDKSSANAELRKAYGSVRHYVALHLDAMLDQLSILDLTRAFRSVFVSLNVPDSLNWERWKDSSVYTATCADKNMFAINILTGLTLFNGRSCRRLSPSILDHPRYKRTFGDCNFEVVLSHGWEETLRPVQGYIYRFLIDRSSHLHIEEYCVASKVTLSLPDPKELETITKLPVRLFQMHDFWYYEAGDALLFRPINFMKKAISFIARGVSSTNSNLYRVNHVSKQDFSSHWLDSFHSETDRANDTASFFPKNTKDFDTVVVGDRRHSPSPVKV